MSQETQSPLPQKKSWTDSLVAKLILMPGAYVLCLAAGILVGWGIFSPADDYVEKSAAYMDLKGKASQCEKQASALRQEIAGGAQAPAAEAPGKSDAKQTKNVYNIGDVLEYAEFDVTVVEVSVQESISLDYDGYIKPGAGESLALFKFHWLNKAKEAAINSCTGPDLLFPTIYDQDGNEYYYSSDSMSISGNNCTAGLLNGQEADYYMAFVGLANAQPTSMKLCAGFGESDCKTVSLN